MILDITEYKAVLPIKKKRNIELIKTEKRLQQKIIDRE